MSITAICEALIEAGATPQMLLAAIRADEFARGQKVDNKREKDRLRKQSARAIPSLDSSLSADSTDSADKEKAVSSPSPFPPITPLTPTPSSQKELRLTARAKVFVLPDWIPKEDWADYLEMRMKAKKPATDAAKKSAVAKLERLRQNGHDPGAVLQQSTFHNWPGLYEIKENHGSNQQNYKPNYGKPSVTESLDATLRAIDSGRL